MGETWLLPTHIDALRNYEICLKRMNGRLENVGRVISRYHRGSVITGRRALDAELCALQLRYSIELYLYGVSYLFYVFEFSLPKKIATKERRGKEIIRAFQKKGISALPVSILRWTDNRGTHMQVHDPQPLLLEDLMIILNGSIEKMLHAKWEDYTKEAGPEIFETLQSLYDKVRFHFDDHRILFRHRGVECEIRARIGLDTYARLYAPHLRVGRHTLLEAAGVELDAPILSAP